MNEYTIILSDDTNASLQFLIDTNRVRPYLTADGGVTTIQELLQSLVENQLSGIVERTKSLSNQDLMEAITSDPELYDSIIAQVSESKSSKSQQVEGGASQGVISP